MTHSQFICDTSGDAFEVTNLFSGNRYPAEWFLRVMTGDVSNDSGERVNGYTALTNCALWQGVNIISGDIGQVPVRLVHNEFVNQKQHPAWNLLRVRPNDLQTPRLFKETLIQWALIWGNFVGWVVRRGATPVDIIPLRPDCLRPELVRFDDGQVMLYHYISPTAGREFTFFPDDVVHIQGLTGDGVWGYALHEIAKNCIGHGLALEKHGNRQFSNGAMPGGILKHPARLTPDSKQDMREDWYSVHGGASNAGKIAILTDGVEFQQIAQTNIDAQWLEAKKLNVVDVARLLNLPAHKLNALEDSSVRANLEEQNETYKQMTLTRWSNAIDEEFRRKLLTDQQWKSDEYQFVFDWDTFLRADVDTRSTVADRLVKATIWNPNEARHFMGYAPRKGGEEYGNPMTTPNEPAKPTNGQKQPENEPKTPQNRLKTVENAHRELVYNQFVVFIERESHELIRQAKSAANFIRWLDCFYLGTDGIRTGIESLSDSILGASVRACLAVGIDARGVHSAVNSYAKARHKQLLEVCSAVNRDELPAAIEKLVGEHSTLVAQGLLATALNIEHETNGVLYAE